MKRSKALGIRALLDGIVSALQATDETSWNAAAAEVNAKIDAFRVWLPGIEGNPRNYTRGDIRIDEADNVPYWAMHTHTSYAGAELQPSITLSIWAHCHGTSFGTARPFVAEGHNPYMEGHFCMENGTVYRCKVDNTVHAPSVLPEAWVISEE